MRNKIFKKNIGQQHDRSLVCQRRVIGHELVQELVVNNIHPISELIQTCFNRNFTFCFLRQCGLDSSEY